MGEKQSWGQNQNSQEEWIYYGKGAYKGKEMHKELTEKNTK